jgi:hypothetical protein
MTNPRGFIKLRSALQRRRAVVFAGITAAVGLIAVFVVMAAGNPIGFEAETGQLGGTASTISLAGASGGTAVKFGDGATAAALCDGYSNWSDAATWGGSVPAAGSVVTIPATKKVKLDVDVPHLGGLNVPAGTELCLPDRPTVLSSKFIAVMGKFTAGTDANPIKSDVTIKLEGGVEGTDIYTITGQAATDVANYNRTNGTTLGTGEGANIMIGLNGGVIDLFGEKRGLTWTSLNAQTAVGASSLLLKDAVTWRVGDKIVVASGTTDPLGFDEETITSVSPDGKTIGLAVPMKFRHAGSQTCLTAGTESRCVDERSEVGLLSHSVKITGPDNAVTTHYGGHTMIMGGGTMHADNIELHDMGQEGVLGRYPFHFHIVGDASSSFIKNVSTYHSYNRQLTIHGTNNLLVSGMVAHDGIGHSIMLENGFEEGNVFDHDLVMTTRLNRDPSKRILFTDTMPSAFWITNGNNTLTNNSAAGSEGSGIWYDPTGFGSTDVIGANYADHRPFLTLDNNIAHSVNRPGDRDEFTNSHGDGTGIITQSNTGIGTRTGRGTAHNNSVWMNDTGLWIDGGFDFVDTKAANNHRSLAPSFGVARGGIIYNVGTKNTVQAEAAGGTYAGLRFYHGAGDAYDIWQGGFNVPYAYVYGNDDNSASAGDADNRIGKIRFFGAGNPTYATNYRWMLCFTFYWCSNANSSHWIIDTDGSTLGTGDPSTPNGNPLLLYKNQPLMTNAAQDKTLYTGIQFDWDGPVTADLTRYRPLATLDQGTLRVRFGEADTDAVKLTRDDGVSDTGMLPALLNGRTYTIAPQTGTTFTSLGFDWSGSPPSTVKMVIPWGSATAPAIKSGYACSGASRPQATSLANLGVNGDWYFDPATHKITVAMISKGTAPDMGYGGFYQSGNNYWCMN